MKKNMFKYLTYSLVAAAALTFGSCSSDDKYDVEGNPDNLIYFKAGEVNSNVYTADVRHTPVGDYSNLTIKIPVYVQQPVSNATRVTVALDNSQVDAYNEEKGTTYPVLPDAAIELLKTTVTLDANEYSSTDSIEARLTENLLATLTEPEYMTAFRITDVNGNGKASEERGVIYVKVQTGTDYIHVNSNDEVHGSIAHTPIGSLGNVSIDLPAYVNQAAKVGATATITVDNSLVAEYNAEHGTNYPAAPNGVLNIENASVTIAQGETSSATNFKAAIPSDKMAQLTGPQYLIPLRISAKRTDGSTVDNAGVIYMIFTTAEVYMKEGARSSEMRGTEIQPNEMGDWTCDKDDISYILNTGDWYGWEDGAYVIDMKEVKNVTGLRFYPLYSNYSPTVVMSVSLSEDGSNWTECGTTSSMSRESRWLYYVLYGAIPARYVKVDYTTDIWGYYHFGIETIRVYAE